MKIGVDAGCLGIRHHNLQVGVYQVAKNLLIELGKIDKSNTYILYSFHSIDKELMKQFGSRMKNVVVRPSRGWMKLALPLRMSVDRIDLFLGLSQAIPQVFPFIHYRTIVFIYDLAFERYPEMYPDSFAKLHLQTDYAATLADAIVTISHATEKNVMRGYTVSPGKIFVAYPGIRKFAKNKKRQLESKDYFLFVGALKRIKNVPRLIKAFALFAKKIDKEYRLVVVGGTRWYDPAIDTALRSLPKGLQKKIEFMGFVDDANLSDLYAHATAFVSPSLYEGFGLPFTEAMAHGCPVIGSTAGAIPEVVGDAGLLCDANDTRSIAGAMYRIATEKSLRDRLHKKGMQRAQHFTWEIFAKDILHVINTLQ